MIKKKDFLNIDELEIKKISKLNNNKKISLFGFINILVSNVHLNNFKELIAKFYFANLSISNKHNWNFEVIDYMTKNKERILRYFEDLDFNIVDYEFRNSNPFTKVYEYDSLWLKKENYALEFEWKNIVFESSGTSKIISLVSVIDKVLNEGGIAIIDDLSASLHTCLLEYIIKLFKSEFTNPHKAILLFNSHDLITLDKSVFSNGEIYFSGLDERKTASIWRLSDYGNIDNKKPLWKLYREGKFGADPFIRYSMEKSNENK